MLWTSRSGGGPGSLFAPSGQKHPKKVTAGGSASAATSLLTFQLLEPVACSKDRPGGVLPNHDPGEKNASTRFSGGRPGGGSGEPARAGADEDGRHVEHGYGRSCRP